MPILIEIGITSISFKGRPHRKTSQHIGPGEFTMMETLPLNTQEHRQNFVGMWFAIGVNDNVAMILLSCIMFMTPTVE